MDTTTLCRWQRTRKGPTGTSSSSIIITLIDGTHYGMVSTLNDPSPSVEPFTCALRSTSSDADKLLGVLHAHVFGKFVVVVLCHLGLPLLHPALPCLAPAARGMLGSKPSTQSPINCRKPLTQSHQLVMLPVFAAGLKTKPGTVGCPSQWSVLNTS
jgi:hypothetical protein